MKTPASQARCYFALNGVKHAYGTRSEAHAVRAFLDMRDKEFMLPVLGISTGDGVKSVYEDWKELMYPETRISNLSRLEIARLKFEKYKGKEFGISSIG